MTNPENNNESKEVNNFAKYTSIAFQMLATIGIFTFIGYKIDENRSSHKLIFTAIFGAIGTLISLFMVIRGLIKNKD